MGMRVCVCSLEENYNFVCGILFHVRKTNQIVLCNIKEANPIK